MADGKGKRGAAAGSAGWRLEDVINFEHFLHLTAEDENSPDAAGDVLPDEVRIGIATHSQADPEKARRHAFLLWLRARLKDTAPVAESLPGNAFATALRHASLLLSVIAFLAGTGVVLGLLERPAFAFNLTLFIGVTILLQLALLLILFLGWLFRRRLLGSSALSAGQSFAQWLVLTLARRVSPDTRDRLQGFRRYTAGFSRLLRWPLVAITQTAAIWFNLGLIAAFIGCLLFIHVRFYWESTPALTADDTLHQVTRVIASPWSSWRPQWAPTEAQFEATRLTVTADGERALPAQDAARTWIPFLLAALVTWGLLPRLLLRTLASFYQRRALASVAFTQRRHRELWRQLTAVNIEARPEDPADSCLLFNWNGIECDAGELRRHILQQLRFNPVATHVAGAGTATADESLLSSLSGAPPAALTILAEAWNLVPARFTDFHLQLRASFGNDLPIHVFLLGSPSGATPFTSPSPEDLAVWNTFADSLDDPLLAIHPYHQPQA